MDQYYPAGRVSGTQFVEINRRVGGGEYWRAVAYARSAGLWRLDHRRLTSM